VPLGWRGDLPEQRAQLANGVVGQSHGCVIMPDSARDVEMDRLDVDYGLARPAVNNLEVAVDAGDQ
jgi:hypothetical protein